MHFVPESLTPRESAVLDLLRSGMTNKQIARSIGISEQTVKYHLKNIYGKLGALGRAHAVAISDQARTSSRSATPGDAAAEPAIPEVALSPLSLLRRTRRLHADRTAIEHGQRSLSYRAFFERCDRAAALLSGLGVTRGDRVVVLSPNSIAHLEQYHALPHLGAIVVPLNLHFGPEDIAGVVTHCEARVVCAAGIYADAVDAVRDRLHSVTHCVLLDGTREGWIDYEAALSVAAAAPAAAPVQEEDPISINYTSGTGAHPKGVVLSHRNAWINTVGVLLHWPMQCSDRYLWNLPMFHVNGWGFVWTVTAVGATHVVTGSIEAEDLAEQVRCERITTLCAGRATLAGLRALHTQPLDVCPGLHTRVLIAAAAPSAGLIQRVELHWGWDITQAYGLSESSPFLTVCESRPEHAALDDAGRYRIKARQGVPLLTGCELRVVDEEGLDVPADGQTLGEVVVRGPMLMKGYYRDAAATARAFAGGHLHTGDAAVMHADGYIEIRDRLKDIIISGDEIISSIEIEEALAQHPDVRDVAVVGRPDDVLGERVQAYVQLKPGASINEVGLLAFALTRLNGLRVPAAIRCVESLPRTATGKVQKYRLRGRA